MVPPLLGRKLRPIRLRVTAAQVQRLPAAVRIDRDIDRSSAIAFNSNQLIMEHTLEHLQSVDYCPDNSDDNGLLGIETLIYRLKVCYNDSPFFFRSLSYIVIQRQQKNGFTPSILPFSVSSAPLQFSYKVRELLKYYSKLSEFLLHHNEVL